MQEIAKNIAGVSKEDLAYMLDTLDESFKVGAMIILTRVSRTAKDPRNQCEIRKMKELISATEIEMFCKICGNKITESAVEDTEGFDATVELGHDETCSKVYALV